MRILFAGGGTGGHLYPGLAIARAVVRLEPGVQPFFIGAQRGIERDVLPGTGFPFALLDLHPLYRSAPHRNVKTLVGAFRAWRSLTSINRDARPAAIVGTGGYAAGVALAWGRAHGVPLVLHEPDSHPGLTTRAFARAARAVFLGFPEAAQLLKTRKSATVLALGCPIDPPASVAEQASSRAAARALWDLPASAFVVLIVGGSQGARAINETIKAWTARGLPEDVALIWATGKNQIAAYVDRESRMVRVRPYLSPITDAYAACDLAITRAGAMTIAELCAWGIPSILIPLPTAAQDHQTHNAKATAAAGAAIYMPQNEATAEGIDAQVRALRAQPGVLQKMKQAALERARPHAAENIARTLLNLVDPSHSQ